MFCGLYCLQHCTPKFDSHWFMPNVQPLEYTSQVFLSFSISFVISGTVGVLTPAALKMLLIVSQISTFSRSFFTNL